MRGRLLIFCGIPGSGKTTIARMVTDATKDSILIQTDEVRAMLAHPTFSSAESRFVYAACFGIAEEALKTGYLVILDGTFMREEYRAEARKRFRGLYSKTDTVWVSCGLQTALKRNARRDGPVPPEKVKGILRGFEAPRRALRVDTSRLSARAASNMVLHGLFKKEGSGLLPDPRQ